jgi:hypothetical protein
MEEYKYYCDKCQYGTNLKSSFEAHNKTILHITGKSGKKKDKKIFACDDCDFTSTNENNLLTHKLNNHCTAEEKKAGFKYYCDSCDFGVFTESSFNIHCDTIKHKRQTNKVIKNKNDLPIK